MWWRIGLALLVGGCAQANPGGGLVTGSITPSASISSSAASSERLTGTLYRVRANDRKIGNPTEQENYMLLKAAETAKAAGGTHFILVQAGDVASDGMFSLQNLAGNASRKGAFVRVITLEPGTPAPVGAISADEIIHFFGPTFGRKPA